MSNPDNIDSAKGRRDNSLQEELAFCRRALESGTYDSWSDKAWVALCENVCAEAHQVTAQGADEALPLHEAAQDGEKNVPEIPQASRSSQTQMP